MRRRTTLTALTLLGSLGALACSDKQNAATAPDYVRAGSGFVCNFTVTKSDARTYLPAAVQTDAQSALRAMQDAYSAADTAGARKAGFDFIRRFIVAAHDGGTAAGTPDEGSKLTNDLFACMAIVGMSSAVNFAPALGLAGGYKIRGGDGDSEDAVSALGRTSAIRPDNGTFAGWVGQRVLFYGAPLANTFLVNETRVGSAGYSWSTIPAVSTFNYKGTVGVCVAASEAADTARGRIQEVNNATGKLLVRTAIGNAFSTAYLDCSTTLTVGSRSALNRLTQLALSAILPEPAYAAGLLGGGTGGTVNGLSDFGVVDIVSATLSMSRVKDATTASAIPEFTVTAQSAGGSLLPDVVVTLAVTGNSGSFNITPLVPTATTDANGVAKFSGVVIDKAGGYTITASGSTTGIAAASTVNSNLFHIKQ